MYIVLSSMYETMSISTGLYPNLDLWNANKLHYIYMVHKMAVGMAQTFLRSPLFLLHYLQYHQYNRLQYHVTMSYPQLMLLSFSAHSAVINSNYSNC
jgi:hypothetical protein